jgi:hypothetical protein
VHSTSSGRRIAPPSCTHVKEHHTRRGGIQKLGKRKVQNETNIHKKGILTFFHGSTGPSLALQALTNDAFGISSLRPIVELHDFDLDVEELVIQKFFADFDVLVVLVFLRLQIPMTVISFSLFES